MGRTPTQGGGEPLIPASRPTGVGSTASGELELLRRKLKVGWAVAKLAHCCCCEACLQPAAHVNS